MVRAFGYQTLFAGFEGLAAALMVFEGMYIPQSIWNKTGMKV
jgi:hypothetical protein